MSLPLLIAHRGASGHAPENTLAAFRLAFALGADGVELDIHQSKDGALVVCHDSRIDRTTNGSGEIGDMTLRELKRYDAGTWFDPKFSGERLPTLEEVISILPPGAWLNIELKTSPRGFYPLEHALVRSLLHWGGVGRVIISSFEPQYLLRIHRLCPELLLGLLLDPAESFSFSFASLPPIPLFSLHPHFAGLSRQWVKQAHRRGIRIIAWTANHAEDFAYCLPMGIDGVITDYPDTGVVERNRYLHKFQ